MTALIEDKPAAGARVAWSFPAVTRTSAQGVTVVAAHLPGRAMVSLNVIADAGATAEPAGLEGIAEVTMTALLRGARGLDEEALAIAFETVGATPSEGADFDHASLSLSAPGGLLNQAAELVADVVRRPTLDPDEVRKVRDANIDQLAAAEAEAQYVADRVGRKAFFSAESRFAVSASGLPDPLRSVDAEAVKAFHAARWAASPLTVVLVGDLTGVDLDAIAGAFAVEVVPTPRATTSAAIAGGGRRIVLTDMPGSVQSVLDFTAPGPRYDIPDAPQLHVAQAIVLAAFSARVNQRLREDLGYTYGAMGSFSRDRDGGTLNLGTQVRNEVTADSIRETIAVLEASLGEAPLTDAEVEQARENLISKFAVQYDGASAVAGAIVMRVVHDLADDDRDVMLARLHQVTTDQVNEVWRKYVNLDELLVTVVGDASQIRESLESLDLPIIDA